MGIMRSQVQWKIFSKNKKQWFNIVGYCPQHEISTVTFYACRKKLGVSQSAFVRNKNVYKFNL
jgi:hypothetical protein